ncbi:MAG: DUF2996 domain-containing protein [Moorea sp. SIO3C2]|nr:DUF2996 domain-containing protein [Moorena sp. SIO3C2]
MPARPSEDQPAAKSEDQPAANTEPKPAAIVDQPPVEITEPLPAAKSEDKPQAKAPAAKKPAAKSEDKPQAKAPAAKKPAAKSEDKPQAKAPAAKKPAEKSEDKPAAKAPAAKAPAATEAKAKKAKPPAIEKKPFTEFVEQHYVPALKTAFAKQGIDDVDVTFAKQKIPIPSLSQMDDCWQVMGSWQNGQRKFNVYFLDEDIKKQKAFSASANGVNPSTIESFMIDERRVTLDLMVHYTIQRLNAQKWLMWN